MAMSIIIIIEYLILIYAPVFAQMAGELAGAVLASYALHN